MNRCPREGVPFVSRKKKLWGQGERLTKKPVIQKERQRTRQTINQKGNKKTKRKKYTKGFS